jgi:hypothetical protein
MIKKEGGGAKVKEKQEFCKFRKRLYVLPTSVHLL